MVFFADVLFSKNILWSTDLAAFSICASRHNGVSFLICHLVSWFRTRRFSEPFFRSSRAPKIIFRDVPFFSRTYIFFFLIFSTSYLLPSDFLHIRISSWLFFFLTILIYLTILSEILTSEFPSTILFYYFFKIKYYFNF